jgi:pseudaminic acid biosynthesis-associated methylase
MNKQLEHWTGTAGHEYIERNDFADYKLEQGVTAYKRILKGLKFHSLLEVGSNIGLNLWYISEWAKKLNQIKELHAVEPYEEAYEYLHNQRMFKLSSISNRSGFELPFIDHTVDIVMTSGVLIHVAPENLKRMTDEIVRVSKKYIICSEYFSDKPEAIPYRGKADILFKRDFGKFYLENYNLKCVNYGFLWESELPIFNNLTWWVFEKQG